MYSLEKLFYACSALFSCLALLLFGLYFDLGDMVLAAFKGPGALATWNTEMLIREAERDAVPDEIRPQTLQDDSFFRRARRGNYGAPALYAPPSQDLEAEIQQQMRGLKKRGLRDPDYLFMESIYRVDRRYSRDLYAVNAQIKEGGYADALDRLEATFQELHPKNLKAKRELLSAKVRLLTLLGAPPEESFAEMLRYYRLELEVAEIEVRGLEGIKGVEAQSQYAKLRLRQLQEKVARLEAERDSALKLFREGMMYGDLGTISPEYAKILRTALEKKQKEGKVSPEQSSQILSMVETRLSPPGASLEDP